MDAAAFRRIVRQTFGPRLDNATPAGVQEFATWFAGEIAAETGETGVIKEAGRYVLDETTPLSLEGTVKAFLDGLLDIDSEEARQRLWVALLELWYSVLEYGDEERLRALFRD